VMRNVNFEPAKRGQSLQLAGGTFNLDVKRSKCSLRKHANKQR
jgi:hypothetical protein